MFALAAPKRGAGLANARMRERATHACFVYMFALAAPKGALGWQMHACASASLLWSFEDSGVRKAG